MSGIWLVSYVALWLVVLVFGTALVALARQIGLLHHRLPPSVARMGSPGPKVGDRLPPLDEQGVDGRRITWGAERERQTLVVFLSPGCESCDEVAPAVRSIARSERSRTETIVIVPHDAEHVDAAFFSRHRLDELPILASEDLADELGVATTPYALLVDSDGVLRTKGIVNNLDQLVSLFNAIEVGHPTFDAYMAHQNGHSHERSAAADA